jgi:hypothetical protein
MAGGVQGLGTVPQEEISLGDRQEETFFFFNQL